MKDEYQRYARQTVLPEIGIDGQKKLAGTSVLCVGAGGLGSPALLYLAAAGIGKISIADFDTIAESNLQRQILFTEADIGQPKATQAQQRLRALNPHLQVDIIQDGLHADNAEELFTSHDIILDGSDNFATKFLINDAAVKYHKPWVYGAIQGFDGQVSVFNVDNGPCYRCLLPSPPQTHITNCAEAGVMGAVAGLIGVTQALQVIQLATGHPGFKPLTGKLWILNTRTMQTRTLTIPKNPECPACSQKSEDISLTFQPPSCSAISELTPEQINRHYQGALLIDVRNDTLREKGFIRGSKHLPLADINQGTTPASQPEQTIILYCQKGISSVNAARLLQEKGFSNVHSMQGGYEGWLEAK